MLAALDETGQVSRCSASRPTSRTPTPPSAQRQVERQKAAIDLSRAARRPHCRTLSGQRYPGDVARGGDRADRRGHPPLARVRRTARRRPVHGEPLQGRHLAVPRVRPAGRRLPGNPRAHRLAIFGVQYDPSNAIVGGYDPVAVPREGQAPRRDDARLGPLSRPGTTLDDLRKRTAPSATPTSCGTARPARD